MPSYAYHADLFCGDCAAKIMEQLDKENVEDDGTTDAYPQTSQNDESDCPEYCAECGVFLENHLTDQGRSYTIDLIVDFIAHGNGQRETMDELIDCYNIRLSELLDVFSTKCKHCGCGTNLGNEICIDCQRDKEDMGG